MTTNKLNQARVADLHTTMSGDVERGDIPGIVTRIARGGEVHVDATGTTRRHTIFRITSITKPITAAATMIPVGRRLWRFGVLGSGERLHRHPADAAPDGFTGAAGSFHGFPEVCVSFAGRLNSP